MSRPRLLPGTRRDTVQIGWRIEREYKEQVDNTAARAGVSAAVFVERLLDHLREEMTVQGLPYWWPEAVQRDGELELPQNVEGNMSAA